MPTDNETSPLKSPPNETVNPTVIDLDPDQVVEEGKAKEEPAPAATAPQPRAKTRFSLGLPALAATLLIGVIGGGWLYRDALSSYFPSDQVRALSDRVDVLGKGHEGLAAQVQAMDRLAAQLTTDVNALETTTAETQSTSKAAAQAIESLRTNIKSLETALADAKSELATLAARPAVSGGKAATADLPQAVIDRLAALEKDVAALKAQKGGALDTAALSQTLADLKAKIEAGTGFADEQGRLARMVPAAAGLDVLALHAEQGLPNAKGLATELAALAPTLPTPPADEVPPGERSYWDQAWDALSSIITIRDAAAINWQVEAAKAQAFAEAGDLAEAVAALDAPETALPAGLQQWRDRAAARLTLEAALQQASDSVARTLSAGQ